MQGLDAGVSRDLAEGFMLVGERNDLVATLRGDARHTIAWRDLDRPMRFASRAALAGLSIH